jgi:lysophospholipase L1-like esterase
MAHLDPHIAEQARQMAHPPRKPSLGPLGPLGAALAAVTPAWIHRDTNALDSARASISTGVARSGRRFLPVEPRRREMMAVMLLLVVASLFSVAGPISGFGSTPGSPSDGIAAGVDSTPDVTATPAPTPDPGGSFVIEPTAPPATPTPKPRPLPTKRPAARPARVLKFVTLGDSLTALQWTPNSPWPSRLDSLDPLLTLVNNAGVPGNTTAQMRARLNTDVYPYNPDVLFVLGGTNDLGLRINQSAIIANLRAILVDARAHKIMVILLVLPPESSAMAREIGSLNTAIVNLARAQRVTYVDIHAPLANANGAYFPKYTSDGLHLSSLGAQVVANTVRARVRLLGF